MEKQIFREKSVNRISSPEELNDYLRVNNPGIWTILAAVIFLLAGFLVWACVGTLETKALAQVSVDEGKAVVYVSGNKAERIAEGMVLEVEESEYTLKDVSFDEYGRAIALADVRLPKGEYEGEVIIERITPIRFLFR
jgi:hypothetical protein